MVDSTRQPAASERGNSYRAAGILKGVVACLHGSGGGWWKPACFAGVVLLAAGCAQTVVPAQPSVEAENLPICTQPRFMPNRSYLVFFAPHSAVLTERMQTIATEFTQHRRIVLAEMQGNVDSSETTRRDRGLGLRRAKAVADVLISLGVPAERILFKDFGTSRPLVPTPPGIAEPQNRRVAFIPFAYEPDWAKRQKCVDWLNATYCVPSSASSDVTACKNALQYLQSSD